MSRASNPSVGDLLHRYDDDPRVQAALQYIDDDDVEMHEMSYEDFAGPMKLSGGRLALRVRLPHGVVWWCRRADGMLESCYRDLDDEVVKQSERTLSPVKLSIDLAVSEEAGFVKYENTPFAEEETDE